MMKKILTIAGSDSSGGAGIQADIKTITAHKMYAMSVITTLTAQNTMAVTSVFDASANFVAEQMDAVFADIFPDAVKIGMVSNRDIIHVVAEKLKEYKPAHIVLDPVMISTSGYRLLSEDAQTMLVSELMPLAELITPNIPEAEALCGFDIKDVSDMERAALAIYRMTGTAVLVKGGHLKNLALDAPNSQGGLLSADSVDVLCVERQCRYFSTQWIPNPNTHGTGCTLSSAIACYLADGKFLEESIMEAKEYLTDTLASMLDLGHGSGPLDHMCRINTIQV
ncbi:hydroxymethylpyrimidine/phosphomethylpyrimidine kinase [Clostridia bacterium]|nr:hydroxymethylpyrimidine/phosphomethylpyrimidine kinase [Clostridia bacterium]